MEILRYPGHMDPGRAGRCVVALGMFDGVHLGHQEILRRCRTLAARCGARSAVFTFDRHPFHVIRPCAAPAQLTDMDDRLALIEDAGIELAVVAGFDERLARATPDVFVRDVLARDVGAVGAVAGYNYTFGWRAEGKAEALARLGAAHGVVVEIVDAVTVDGVPVGSTEIRARLARGDVAGARAMLGRPFSVRGVVVHGDGRGRTMGFPTANVQVPAGMALPGRGVYAVAVVARGGVLVGVANVGTRPTFGERAGAVRLEVFIADFSGDLYGEAIRVSFVRRLRDEIAFISPLALATQIGEDVKTARRALTGIDRGNANSVGALRSELVSEPSPTRGGSGAGGGPENG